MYYKQLFTLVGSSAHYSQEDLTNRQKIRLKWCVRSWKWNSILRLSTITPLFTRFMATSPPLTKYFSKQIGNWYYYFFPKERKELGIWWQKRDFLLYCGVGDNISVFSACLIVNRSGGALSTNAFAANLHK